MRINILILFILFVTFASGAVVLAAPTRKNIEPPLRITEEDRALTIELKRPMVCALVRENLAKYDVLITCRGNDRKRFWSGNYGGTKSFASARRAILMDPAIKSVEVDRGVTRID